MITEAARLDDYLDMECCCKNRKGKSVIQSTSLFTNSRPTINHVASVSTEGRDKDGSVPLPVSSQRESGQPASYTPVLFGNSTAVPIPTAPKRRYKKSNASSVVASLQEFNSAHSTFCAPSSQRTNHFHALNEAETLSSSSCLHSTYASPSSAMTSSSFTPRTAPTIDRIDQSSIEDVNGIARASSLQVDDITKKIWDS